MSGEQVLLTLVAPPQLSHELVDWLLEQTGSGYFSYQGRGHGSSDREMSIAEQVAGRQKKEVFQIHCELVDAEKWVEQLRQDFNAAGLHYWIVPIIAAGSL